MSVPQVRLVDQFTGDVAPRGVWRGIEAADKHLEEFELAKADADDAAETIDRLLNERDGLACRVQELEAELAARTTERDHYRDQWHQLMARGDK